MPPLTLLRGAGDLNGTGNLHKVPDFLCRPHLHGYPSAHGDLG